MFLCAYKKVLRKPYFSEWVELEKKKKSPHIWFLGNATYNTYVKFQEKIVNPTLVGSHGSFRFINKKHGFW